MGICVLLGLMAWYFGKPYSVRFYETKSEQLLAPGIDMALDMRSSVAVKEGQPLQAKLFKRNVYFDIQKKAANQLEVKIGNAIIKHSGARFSMQLHKDVSGHIATASSSRAAFLWVTLSICITA